MTLVSVAGQVAAVVEEIAQEYLEVGWTRSSVPMKTVRFHLIHTPSPCYLPIAMTKTPQTRDNSPFVEIEIALIYR